MKSFAAVGLLLIPLLCSGCSGSSGSDCAGDCHDTPSATGAHLAHTEGLLPLTCDTCHGEGASDSEHPGHDDGSLTVLGLDGYEDDYGPRPAWYGSTWGGSALFDGHDPSSSVCSGLSCHGMDIVGWTQELDEAFYNRVCTGCHDITPAVFRLPGSGTVYSASTAAANFDGPVSGFSRGGHGDENINNPAWFKDSAPGTSVPLPCVACHDADAPHFPVADGNPFRMQEAALANSLPGASSSEGPLTNLCTQTDCHPKVRGDGDFGFLTNSIKHPSDHFPITHPAPVLMDYPAAAINNEGPSSTTDPAYDPAGRNDPVGLHIDRYVDHWAYRTPSAPATASTADDEPFLPLGDPLLMQTGDAFDNYADSTDHQYMLVTCVTCHNPHGTDLYVDGQIPGQWSTITGVPANRMLRLRVQDDELCMGCH